MHAAVSLLLFAGALGNLRPELVELFEERQHDVRVGSEVCTVNYRLFVPEIAANSRRKYPLIVWLHGRGDGGNDNINQLKWLDVLIFRPPRQRPRFPFFLLAVQCPYEFDGWYFQTSIAALTYPDMVDATKSIIDELLETEPIDPRRVTLSGLSAGGTACWEFAARFSDSLAGVAPLASRAQPRNNEYELAKLPVWAFHSAYDAGSPPDATRRLVHQLTEIGGPAHFTEIDSSEHNCWVAAFEEYGLLDWLLSQEQGSHTWWNQPGRVPLRFRAAQTLRNWTWWQIIVQASLVIVPTGVVLRIMLRWRARVEAKAAIAFDSRG